MTRSIDLVTIVLLASLVLLCVQFGRSNAASRNQKILLRQLDSVQHDVHEINRLTSQSVNHFYGSPPDADVQAAVADVLDRIGLPAATAASVRRESDRQINNDPANSSIRTRDMLIELRSIPPPLLGEFLRFWRDQEPAWTVRSIALRKGTTRGTKANEFHVSMTCTARYTDTRPTP
jgi:hypothetical protein